MSGGKMQRAGLVVAAALLVSSVMASSVSAGSVSAGEAAAALPAPQIIGGTTVSAPVPWMVALLRPSLSPPEGQFCGGTLIDDEWVLTAAHCVDNPVIQKNPANIDVAFGKIGLDQYSGADRRAISEIRVHPNWNFDAITSDVALLRLAMPASGAAVIGLNRDASAPALGAPLDTYGWGSIGGNNFAMNLQHIDIEDRAGPTGPCGDFGLYYMPAHHLCAGVPNGARRTCSGDSGGPLVADTPVPVLVGITSWGWEGCPSGPTVYTRVSSYLPFIDAALNGTDPPPPAVTILAGAANVAEGQSKTRIARIPIALTAPSTVPVTVSYTTVDGTATVVDNDYAKKAGTLKFKPGETHKYIDVKVKGDLNAADADVERFTLALSQPEGAAIAAGTGLGVIQDDEPAVVTKARVASIVAPRTVASTLQVSVPVHLTDTVRANVTVNYEVRQGSATISTGSVRFRRGKVGAFIDLTLPLATPTSGAEFFVHVTSVTGGTIQPDDPGSILVPALGVGNTA